MASAGSYKQRCRAQMDPGAMLSLVTSKLAHSLRAKKLRGTAITISGVGGEIYSTHEVELKLQSLYSTDFITIRASVVNNIPTCITTGDLSEIKRTPAFSSLQLADPEYSSRSQLDLLLGIAHCNICSLNGTVFSVDKTYKAEKTIFGWAVGGVSSTSSANEQASTCMKLAPVQENAEQLLQRFWRLEDVPGFSSVLSREEQAAVDCFRDSHYRDSDGRYVVGLPRREPRLELGKSRETALRRYLSNERSFRWKQ